MKLIADILTDITDVLEDQEKRLSLLERPEKALNEISQISSNTEVNGESKQEE